MRRFVWLDRVAQLPELLSVTGFAQLVPAANLAELASTEEFAADLTDEATLAVALMTADQFAELWLARSSRRW